MTDPSFVKNLVKKNRGRQRARHVERMKTDPQYVAANRERAKRWQSENPNKMKQASLRYWNKKAQTQHTLNLIAIQQQAKEKADATLPT